MPEFEILLNRPETVPTAVIIAIGALTAWVAIAGPYINAAPSWCVQVAEDARLPDAVIDHLRNPDGLKPVERGTLQKILVQRGVPTTKTDRFGGIRRRPPSSFRCASGVSRIRRRGPLFDIAMLETRERPK